MGYRYHILPYAKRVNVPNAIIDLHSRYVLNWSVFNTIDVQWCKETLEEAIALHDTPKIINPDQGSQFTSEVFTKSVLSKKIQLSMDGKEEH